MSTQTLPRTAVAADSLAMLRRSLKHLLRSPDSMIMAVALPIMLMLLFVYVFGGAIDTGTAYINYVVPGIILLCAAFGASTTAVGVSSDMTEGIIDRFRTLPIAQSSFLTGHVLASVVRNLLTTAIVFAVALLMGFRPTSDPMKWLGVIGMIAAFVFVLSYLSTALGLLAKNPEAAGGFTFVIMFLPYVSSAFVPAETMPTWLRWFAENQPITPIIETVRGLLMGTPIGNSAWLAVAWCAVIAAVGFVWANVLYRNRVTR
ncbi:ABC-2 type transport system permease protein [Rhodococcus sp. OK611]|uniref:ABC transporter permease n=1 Tax=unclassified Rhodococcus (in: high G+C Gram-positive bacteria) TaxID=192944 RepID=UPI000BCDD367|nr:MULTISPECIES: ABC transporter permease [unclassified Rhodococcus (in: high G+C Gram-positive bacteria)]PTR43602.1 ABC-2 type transport system permease protein [Rhodococcus sp. OK611]SNX90947.1 ABC-2 type transport system permease protein [Rhodococcus sp. OK270]